MCGYLLRAGVLVGVLCIVYLLLWKGSAADRVACDLTAVTADELCAIAGIALCREGPTLVTDNMAIHITSECTGWFWAAVGVALALAARRSIGRRVGMAVVWGAIVLCVNQLRIITLVLGSAVSVEWCLALDDWVWPVAHGVALYVILAAIDHAAAERAGEERDATLGVRASGRDINL